MQNVQTQEVAYNNANTTNKITVSSKSNFILMAITALLFISMQQWSYYISEFIWFTGIHLRTNGAVAFNYVVAFAYYYHQCIWRSNY